MSTARSLLLPILLLIAGCGLDGETPTEPTSPIRELPRQLSGTERALIQGSNDFAFELLGRVAGSESASNIVLSPLSASFALGMLLNGAAGETFEQMRTTLSFAGLTQSEINTGYAGLLDLLAGLDPAVRFDIANSVWAREGYPFEPSFMDTVAHYFGATTRSLDFADPSSLGIINGWVSDATNGRIETILDAISPNHVMFLINAIYMKGDWTRPFDPERTRSGTFTRRDGSAASVQMMSMDPARHLFAHLEDGTKVLEMTYGREAYSMVFVLPPEDADAFERAASLEAAQWSAWVQALDSTETLVQMPRFELEYERTLNDDLIALGMGDAFDAARADFSRLTPGGVAVDFVKQKTFLKLDEIGTEAAAVTVVAIAESLGPHIFLDRPFLFAIRERLTGTILFVGVIGDPTTEA